MSEKIEYKFEHVGLIVSNLEDSIRWYERNFGFQEIRKFEKKELSVRGTTLILGKYNLELIQPDSPSERTLCNLPLKNLLQKIGTSHFALGVNNIEESYNRLRKNNVGFVTSGIADEKFFFCRDLDGNLIEIKKRT